MNDALAASLYFARKRNRAHATITVIAGVGAITDAAAAAASQTQLTVTFTAADNATAHEARYRPSGEVEWVLVSGVIAAGGNIAGLSAGTTYDVQVRGRRLADTGPWSNIATASTSP